MERIEELKKIIKNNDIDINKFSTLRSFLVNCSDDMFESGYIIALEGINEDLENEIYETTEKLQQYIEEEWEKVNLDYHFKSERGCYFLSTVFSLASDWSLTQGKMRFEEKENDYYHSWLEKDNVVFDPALRVITTKDKYDIFFKEDEKYTKEEVQELLKRTGTFTNYKVDLEEGIIFPIAYFALYDTERAREEGERIISSIDMFLLKNSVDRVNLDSEQYFFDDLDVTSLIKEKAIHMANAIALKESIAFEEAYIKFINSDFFHKLERTNNGFWIFSYAEIENLYFNEENKKKKS